MKTWRFAKVGSRKHGQRIVYVRRDGRVGRRHAELTNVERVLHWRDVEAETYADARARFKAGEGVPKSRPRSATRDSAEARRESARSAIRQILAIGDVTEAHRNKLLSQALWLLTEANGKYTLRYETEGARTDAAAKKQHEHVWPRKWLIAQLKANPEGADRVLANAIGCLVTIAEHHRLGKVPTDVVGWDRYRDAGIRVFDTEAKDWIVP